MAEKDAGAEEITLPAFTFEDGKIDVTQASGPDFTDQIVTPPGDEEIAAYLRKVELAIKESKFGTVDVQDFKDFSTTGAPVQEGEYLFRVESAHLKLATSVLDGIVARSSQAATTVTLFSDRAKFAAFIYPTFAEILLKTTAPITNVPAGHEVAFALDQQVLGEVAWRFSTDAIIALKYIAERRILEIRGDVNLNINTWEPAQFPDHHRDLKEVPVSLGKIRPEGVAEAIRFLSSYAHRNDLQPQFALVDIYPTSNPKRPRTDGHAMGRAVGGDLTAIAAYESPDLAALEFRIIYSAIPVVLNVLSRLHPDHTQLFKVGNYILFRDQNLYFGLTWTDLRFPVSVDAFLAPKSSEYVVVNRHKLLRALSKVAVVNLNPNLPVRLTLSGHGGLATLRLETRNSAGKISYDLLEVSRRSTDPQAPPIGFEFPELDFSASLTPLRHAVERLKTADVVLEPLTETLRVGDIQDKAQAYCILPITQTKRRDEAASSNSHR
jgi:hypothetical protein